MAFQIEQEEELSTAVADSAEDKYTSLSTGCQEIWSAIHWKDTKPLKHAALNTLACHTSKMSPVL
jgi:hypothetical protein